MDEISQERPAHGSGALAVFNERRARSPFLRSLSATRAIAIPRKWSPPRMLKSSSLPTVSEFFCSPNTTMLTASSRRSSLESEGTTATTSLLGSPAGSPRTGARKTWQPIRSRSEVNGMIDRESRNTAEYTTLDNLIQFTQNDDFGSPPNFGSPRLPLKDNIVEKICRLYLQASEAMNQQRQEGFGCALLRHVRRFVGAAIQCFTGTSTADTDDIIDN